MNDSYQQIDEIGLRLAEKRASVMVGAGFSRNLRQIASQNIQFPTWNELGIIFYKRLHGKPPEGNQFLDPMQIAEELEAAIGRPGLELLIRESIPDLQCAPSKLHERMMDLPWNDVFTTNYDTLLERAAEKTISRRYDIVVNQEDLIFSTSPRIIKLHGSFPSQRPLVATQEDYRRYPVDFALFVNTVQQSLVENLLVLVGFSGQDPNFLKWIGWIRDNYGKNAPLIYMIVCEKDGFSQAKLRFWSKQNIVPVNLALLVDDPVFLEDAFKKFFHRLEIYISKRNPFSWP